MTLMEFLRSLMFDDEARQDFAENPDHALEQAGLGDLNAEDVSDALTMMHDDSQSADFSREYNGGDQEVNIAAPSPVEHHDGGDSESAAEYITRYVQNNYVTNEGDTITDNSINQQIDTGGGDFDQDIDVDSTVASGDGAVAAGDDIEDSTITSGDDNIVGDDNIEGDGNTSISGDGNSAVIGDGNTSGFGDGDVSSTNIDGDVSVDDGSSFAIGGDSSVDSRDQSDDDVNIDNSDNSTNDSNNTETDWHDESDNSSHTSVEDNDEYSEYSDSSDHSTHEDNDSSSSDDHSSVDSDYSIDA
ncbi:IniB N-terminal domain-containing protein [Pseudonocardia sp. DLS-67]